LARNSKKRIRLKIQIFSYSRHIKKLDSKLLSKIDLSTIGYQNHIINRLKLYDFAKSAISLFCKDQKHNLVGYDYPGFKNKFKLLKFNPDKEIKSIKYNEIIDVGNKFIGDELADSIFVLNVSTFENWVLTMLNYRMKDNKTNIFIGDDKAVDISIIQESADIDELWDTIIRRYLQKLPYSGMKSMLLKLLKEFDIKHTDMTPDLIDKLNENSLCRNLIVHNQKKVNDEYIQKSGKFAVFKQGDSVEITEKLLFEQGDNLLVFMQDFRKVISV